MKVLRRIHLESPLSPGELRDRFEHAMGHSSPGFLQSNWTIATDPPFIGDMNGNSFEGTRRSQNRYAKVVGSIAGNAIDAEIGLATWRFVVAIASIVVFPVAAYLWIMIAIDLTKIEAKLRELANVAR